MGMMTVWERNDLVLLNSFSEGPAPSHVDQVILYFSFLTICR